MDLSTIIGIVLGFALIVWGIKIPQLPNFWDPQSLALTLGGTVAAVVASFPFSQLKRMGSHFKILVQGDRTVFFPWRKKPTRSTIRSSRKV